MSFSVRYRATTHTQHLSKKMTQITQNHVFFPKKTKKDALFTLAASSGNKAARSEEKRVQLHPWWLLDDTNSM